MRRMGNLPFQKSCFAHIALLGFQRAGGSVRRIRHATYFTSSLVFFKPRKKFFQEKQHRKSFAELTAFIMNSFCFPFEKISMNSSEMPHLADGCPSFEW